MKFCKDCAHQCGGGCSTQWVCKAPNADQSRDPLTGARPLCSDMRKEHHRNGRLACGNDGRWFKPKTEEESNA